MILIVFHSVSCISLEITGHLCKVIKIIPTFAKNRYEMKVERETAGFALPFTAGVLLAAYSGLSILSSYLHAPAAAILVTAGASGLLMNPARRQMGRHWQWLLVGIAALGAGMICGFTSTLTAYGNYGIFSQLAAHAEGWGLRMQEAIDAIPFSDPRCNAVAKALVTGERSDIPADVITAFRDSGASHILALSGLHLGIIYGIIKHSLSISGNYRQTWIPRSAITILACGSYTLATGAGASIVRAFLFIMLAEAARLSHRNHSTGQLLFAALTIQLTISPLSIRSAGFQLSYAAMAGIAFILPRLQSFWPGSIFDDRPFTRAIRRIWNICAMSISCQMTTAPIAYIRFGTLPGHFLLTNLLALPLTALIIPAVLVTMILETADICPGFVISTCEILISALISALEIIATM